MTANRHLRRMAWQAAFDKETRRPLATEKGDKKGGGEGRKRLCGWGKIFLPFRISFFYFVSKGSEIQSRILLAVG